MKTAIYIEDGEVQLVLSASGPQEEAALAYIEKALKDGTLQPKRPGTDAMTRAPTLRTFDAMMGVR